MSISSRPPRWSPAEPASLQELMEAQAQGWYWGRWWRHALPTKIPDPGRTASAHRASCGWCRQAWQAGPGDTAPALRSQAPDASQAPQGQGSCVHASLLTVVVTS